jgi:hypothetical protein
MVDPADLTRRASELRKQAEQEEHAETRDRLVRMADYYLHIVENETWLAAQRAYPSAPPRQG